MSKKNGDTPKGTTTNDTDILQELIKASYGTNYSRWLRVIWNNQGILTNELCQHGLESNNHHHASQEINLRIEPLGWKIVKRVKTKPNKSWAWFIAQIPSEQPSQLDLNYGGKP